MPFDGSPTRRDHLAMAGAKKVKPKGYTHPMDRLAAVVMGQVKVAGAQLADPALDPQRRAVLERRLLKAYEALWPTWPWSIVQNAIVRALELPRAFLRDGKWSEAVALRRAVESITGVMNDAMAPPELAGRIPDRELVLACLRAPAQRRGRPTNGQKSQSAALLALFKNLDVSGATSSASVNRMLERKAQRTRH